MKKTSMWVSGLALLCMCQVAVAGETPNLVGTWKGKATGVHIGATLHRKAEPGVNFGKAMEFDFEIAEQHGSDFTGKMKAGSKTEALIGSIQPDNKGGIMLDDDGQYIFTIVDGNTIDYCYFHSIPGSKVTGCARATR